jgi:thiol:disulfide interchange protein DsbC
VRVKVGSDYLYVIGEGRYALTGDLLDLERGENLTAAARAQDRLAALASFPEKDRIVFPAKGEERAVLVVFTDTTCPYCRRLHGDVPELQRNGVAVHYVPFPRAGIGGEGAQEMRGVWCADDRRRATDVAMGVRAGDPAKDGDCPAADSVARGYRVGQRLGIRGTPAIVLPDGRLVQGYRPPRALLGAL